VSAADEPILGWRVWRLHDRGLHSLVLDYRWEPGENRAVCLASHRPRCAESPGRDCLCGFWAAASPRLALTRTCVTIEPPYQVLGLVAVSGAVVDHGAEGLRAERAELRCLCSDRPWSWLPPASGSWDELRAVAEDYAVPLLSLSNAVSIGLAGHAGDPNVLSTDRGQAATGGRGWTAR
jgi:hypothetical protein